MARLRAAYRTGIFPWYDERVPPLWWCPDPRAVITPESLHVPRRLERTLRQGRLTATWDRAFDAVMQGCGENREEGTWVTPEIRRAYGALYRAGHAHSLEVWSGESLVGGAYGVAVGGVFAAESMFHRVRDASKVALVRLARFLFAQGVELIDVQFVTSHLLSLGAVEIPRQEYVTRVRALRNRRIRLRWQG